MRGVLSIWAVGRTTATHPFESSEQVNRCRNRWESAPARAQLVFYGADSITKQIERVRRQQPKI